MTKEAILEHWFPTPEGAEETKHILKAMSDYAQQQAIEFAKFIAYNDIKPHDIDTWNEGRHNTHELYDDFLQHQFIEKQNANK